MQGGPSAPAAPASEPPSTEQIKTEDVICEAKVEANKEVMEEMEVNAMEKPSRQARTMSIDSDNRSDRSEDEEKRSRKRPASPSSPLRLLNAKRPAQVECTPCRLRFDNRNTYELHRFASHGEDSRTIYNHVSPMMVDTKRVTDNYSPHISDLRYKCDACPLDFSTTQALDMHRAICTKRLPTPERLHRDDFFAKLDLKNRSFGIAGTLTPPMERFVPKFEENGIKHMDAARDLADIQSILNVTSASSLLERLTSTRVGIESTMLTPPDTCGKEREQEETQDSFAAEFRRMKLRGEFPCRLCPAKFPNLRALKGHNRVHLSGNGPGPYRCNMCPHASLDKAALVRHMRTHNGDRPYECAVCNYAFTTKANCERHLRNRHSKLTREDVKRSIIYHPSEDPNNDEMNPKTRDEVKRSLAFHTPDIERRSESSGRESPISHYTPSFLTDRHQISLTPQPLLESPVSTPKDPIIPMPRIKVKGIGQLTQMPEYRHPPEPTYNTNNVDVSTYDEDAPVDLSINDNNSCDVLDLSKKKVDTNNIETKPQRSLFEPDPAMIAMSAFDKTRFLLAQQKLLESSIPKLDAAYYAQLSQLYAGGIPGLPGLGIPPSFPLNPYFLQTSFFPHPGDPQELIEIKQKIQKEIIRGLSMSGGRLVTNDLEPQPKLEPVEEEQRPLPRDSPPVTTPLRAESPLPPNNSTPSQADSVRLVIRNGVLIPKQKQRRYRTERPFSCSQCTARFTLRSNMERHIKQQHPQHWSIRRPAPRATTNYPSSDSLADSVKFALLARHLERPLHQGDRSPIRRDSDEVADNEDDEEDALIIDEEPEVKKSEEHTAARRAAAEILMASRHQEFNKDFDLKIAGNLINKPAPLAEKVETGTDPINPAHIPETVALPVVGTSNDEEEDEEGLVASTSEGNNSGSDENKSESDNSVLPIKKKSAYSSAPNRVSCPYCHRKFPWSSSLRRHVLTHTGQKPFKCPHCTLLFTTKSNCDRHLLRKHGGTARAVLAEPIPGSMSPPQPVTDSNSILRNAPERPFRCDSCPSSTFSSLDTLKKHMSSRHRTGDFQAVSPNANRADTVGEYQESVPEGGLAYKCHLCEASFGEREAALKHLATLHAAEYDQLVSKGALDASDRSESADDDDRGKFPDHANRKVVCAFCVRRFWSAEDLRRHMRTHSGERPFACDLCERRFTLKHSMLRHRKKHRDEPEPTDDEEPTPPATPPTTEVHNNGYRYDDDGSGSEIPSNVNNNNSPPAAPFDKKLKIQMATRKYSSEAENDGENGGDLIGKLLGIQDKSIMNKLLSSADEAAKFFGVNK